MVDYDHEDIHHEDLHHEEPTEPPKEEEKAVKTDNWANYYDFIINEGSFKFWAAFQVWRVHLEIESFYYYYYRYSSVQRFY